MPRLRAEALKGMEAVAEHINEMQKIYEEYGSVFNDLMRTYREVHPSKTVRATVARHLGKSVSHCMTD